VCCSVLQCVAVCCSVLQCVAVCCSVLQCVAVCCSMLQYVAVSCSVLQCVAVCCSVLQHKAHTIKYTYRMHLPALFFHEFFPHIHTTLSNKNIPLTYPSNTSQIQCHSSPQYPHNNTILSCVFSHKHRALSNNKSQSTYKSGTSQIWCRTSPKYPRNNFTLWRVSFPYIKGSFEQHHICNAASLFCPPHSPHNILLVTITILCAVSIFKYTLYIITINIHRVHLFIHTFFSWGFFTHTQACSTSNSPSTYTSDTNTLDTNTLDVYVDGDTNTLDIHV